MGGKVGGGAGGGGGGRTEKGGGWIKGGEGADNLIQWWNPTLPPTTSKATPPLDDKCNQAHHPLTHSPYMVSTPNLLTHYVGECARPQYYNVWMTSNRFVLVMGYIAWRINHTCS